MYGGMLVGKEGGIYERVSEAAWWMFRVEENDERLSWLRSKDVGSSTKD